MEKYIKSKYFILILLAFSFLIRLVVLNQSLWLDEAIGAYAVRNFTFRGLFTHFFKADNHPPLYYLILKFWAQIVGYSEVALRMPSIIFGVLTIFFTFKVARKISNNIYYPVIVAVLIATSPFHIYYSQEARMYSMAAFFACLSINSFLSILKNNKPKILDLIIFSFSITCLVFTNYVPVFLLPVFWVAGFQEKKDRFWFLKLTLTFVPIVVIGIFWYPYFVNQSEKGKWLLNTLPAWKSLGGGADLKQLLLVWTKFVLGRISFHDKVIYYSLIIIASVPYSIALFKSTSSMTKNKLIWMWLALPFILCFLFSVNIPIFIYFRFLFIIPAFYLIVGLGLFSFKNKSVIKILLISLITVNLLGWLIYVTQPAQQREQWRQATKFVDDRVASDEAIIFEYPEPFAPYTWYTEGKAYAVGVTDSISADSDKTRQKTERLIADKKGLYYFEYLKDLSDPNQVVEETLRSKGFEISEIYSNFPGVGQIFYWKRDDHEKQT